MGSDSSLGDVVRNSLERLKAGKIREVRMFGGIGFMLNGNLLVGASSRGLLVRVGKEAEREALERRGARPMIMRGRTMAGYVYVDPPALTTRAVRSWVEMAMRFVQTLPAKQAGANRPGAKAMRRRGSR